MHCDRPGPLAPGATTPPGDWSQTRAIPTGALPSPPRLCPPRPRQWHEARGRLELVAPGRPALGAVWGGHAKPDEVFHAIALHNGPHGLTSGCHRLTALVPTPAQ